MFYLLINEKIRELINKIKDIHFGCKYYCPLQIIALDEMELLRKELEKINIILSDEEYKNLIKSTESKYFQNIHICYPPKNKENIIKEEEEENKNLFSQEFLNKDKISKKEENPFFNFDKFEQNYQLRQKQKEENDKFYNKINQRKKYHFNSISSGISLIFSFFLLVLGSYYLGKNFFGLSDSNTYKLMLIVTIIVFISETCLLLLQIHRNEMKELEEGKGFNNIYKNSFAYKFNRNYRNLINNYNNKSKLKKD